MITLHSHPRVIETINVNGRYFADRRAHSKQQPTDKPQVAVYERRRKNSSHKSANIDVWV